MTDMLVLASREVAVDGDNIFVIELLGPSSGGIVRSEYDHKIVNSWGVRITKNRVNSGLFLFDLPRYQGFNALVRNFYLASEEALNTLGQDILSKNIDSGADLERAIERFEWKC